MVGAEDLLLDGERAAKQRFGPRGDVAARKADVRQVVEIDRDLIVLGAGRNGQW